MAPLRARLAREALVVVVRAVAAEVREVQAVHRVGGTRLPAGIVRSRLEVLRRLVRLARRNGASRRGVSGWRCVRARAHACTDNSNLFSSFFETLESKTKK